MISAASAHAGGGTLGSTAGLFCLLHAGSALAIVSLGRQRGGGAPLYVGAAVLLLAGTVIFAGDLALAAFVQWRPLPVAAPIGGIGMIAGWIGVLIAGAYEALGPSG